VRAGPMLRARVPLPRADQLPASPFSRPPVLPTTRGMNTLACRAVAQAGLAAGTASLDDQAPWPLLLVAGWLTTAAELMKEVELREALLA
jgi:hypothetical protein